MAECMENTVVINRGCNKIGLPLQVGNGIAHSDTDAGLKNHRGVVAAIIECYRPTGIKTLMTRYGENTFTLIGPIGRDIGKLRMPTA